MLRELGVLRREIKYRLLKKGYANVRMVRRSAGGVRSGSLG
jgi:hypothetical protein